MWDNLEHEVVAVSGRSAVVGSEDEPSVSGGESGPVVPVSAEMVAVGVCGPAVNECQHPQMLCVLFAWGKISMPSMVRPSSDFHVYGLPFGLSALGKLGLKLVMRVR